jgi:hypothetical protein
VSHRARICTALTTRENSVDLSMQQRFALPEFPRLSDDVAWTWLKELRASAACSLSCSDAPRSTFVANVFALARAMSLGTSVIIRTEQLEVHAFRATAGAQRARD